MDTPFSDDLAPGKGGNILLNASAGGFTASKGAKLDTSGKGDRGGVVAITATAACDVTASVNADALGLLVVDLPIGGDGGAVAFTCSDVTVRKKSNIKVATAKTAAGGTVALTATSGNVTLEKGSLITNQGFTGRIAVTSPGICTFSGALMATSLSQSESGVLAGTAVRIACDSLAIDRSFNFKGATTQDRTYPSSYAPTAASLTADVAGACTVAGRMDVRGFGGVEYDPDDFSIVVSDPANGGSIRIVCGGSVTQAALATVDASTHWGDGGEVKIASRQGPVTLGGKISAGYYPGTVRVVGIGVTTTESSSLAGGFVDVGARDDACNVVGDVSIGKKIRGARGYNARALIEGCNVDLLKGGNVDVGDWDATLVAHKDLSVAGKISATSRGRIVLKYRDGVSIVDPRRINPPATPQQDNTLSPCP